MGFKYIPTGHITVEGQSYTVSSFYMFETEVTNRQYQDFLFDLKKNYRWADYQICKIDSSTWDEALRYENTYSSAYHLTVEFADYPVVNISQEAAEIFCDWLQELMSKKVKKIEVRLPRDYDWMYAARGGLENAVYPWDNIGLNTRKNINYCNYNSPDDGTCLATNYANSYYSNAYGLYNMSGNVAEMMNVPGQSKGGSWKSDALQMKIEAADEYKEITGGRPFIGFRPVAVLH